MNVDTPINHNIMMEDWWMEFIISLQVDVLEMQKWASARIWAILTKARVSGSIKLEVSLGVPGPQWLVPTKIGLRKDNQQSSNTVMGAHGSLMCLSDPSA